jgi:hypothetical protein
VALTSKGQNFDDFGGKTPADMATERIWLHERFTFLQPTSVVPEQIVSALLVLIAHHYSLSKAAVH